MKLKYNLFKRLEFDNEGRMKYPSKRTARLSFLEYVNNFLTYSGFASYYGLTEIEAKILICEGRNHHEKFAAKFKQKTKKPCK